MKYCHACGALWEERHDPGRGETCLRCGADMHCCMNCRHYDPIKAGDCALRNTDPPADKAKANVCDDFQMADRAQPPPSDAGRKRAVEEKWKSLFKD